MPDNLAQSDPGELIRRLAAEVDRLPTPPERSMLRDFYEHPGFLTHRKKTPERLKADAQRQAFFDKLLDAYGPDVRQWQVLPEQLQSQMAYYRDDADGFRSGMKSAYEPTGVMGAGSGLRAGVTWMQSVPGMAYAGSEMLANRVSDAVDAGYGRPASGSYANPNPEREFVQQFNTFTAPLQTASDVSDDYSAWSKQRAARQAFPEDWQVLEPPRDLASAAEVAAAPIPEGEKLLERYGVPKTPARVWGAVMDDTLNPFWEGRAIRRLARSGNMPAALGKLAVEHAPGMGMAGMASLDDLIRRLEQR